MKLTDEEILKACDSTKWIAPEGLALDIGRAIEAAVLAQGEPVAYMYPDDHERMTTTETFCTVYSVQVGSPTQGLSTVALYTHPAPVNQRIAELEAELMEQARVNGMGGEREAKLMARVERLEQALDVALEAMGLIGADFVCEASHHKKQDRHEIGKPCPVQKRWHDAFAKLMEVRK